ncbi:MAG: Esterase [Actinomycetia bacterium]|nr:Esterase [Actinomycetes bacterium]
MHSIGSFRRVRRAASSVLAITVVALLGLTLVVPAASASDARFLGSVGGTPLRAPVVGMAATPSGNGYWMVASDGGIFTFGDAPFLGSLGALKLNAPIVGIAATPTGRGYWMVASDGGIFTFGDAKYLGSLGNLRLNQPIVSMASTPDGKGYWMVASDGGIFTFGDAPFMGSLGNLKLTKPITAMSATASGRGYWLAASDGGIFTFGDAPFLGSLGNLKLTQPIVSMTVTPDRRGYWLAAADGGVFTFGNAPFMGSLGYLKLVRPVVGMAAPPNGTGYWMVGSDGGIFALTGTSPGTPAPQLLGGGSVGPTNTAALHSVGPLTINTPGAVVTNVDVHGQLTIAANNVTVRNFRATNVTQGSNVTGMVLEDGEIHGNNDPNNLTDGVTWANYTARRLDIHNQLDGLKAMGNVLIENCWVHDLNFHTGSPSYGAGDYTHNDAVQISSGSNVTIRNNRFEHNDGNSSIFIDADQGPINNVMVTGNYLGGGSITLFSIISRSAPQFGVPTGVFVTNNIFTEEHRYDYALVGGTVWWAANVNLNGQIVTPKRDP